MEKFCRLNYCSYLCTVIKNETSVKVTKLETINIKISTYKIWKLWQQKVNNQVNESANEVMDARIVKLNEIIGIRLSSISSKEETSRLQNFIDAKNACEKAVKELEAPKAEVKLTDKEQSALEFFVRAMDGEEGFLMEDVEKEGKQIAGISPKSLKGLSSSLQKKGILDMYNGEAYFDGAVTELGMKIYDRLVAEATAEAPKKEAKKADKETKSTKTSGHKVGDVHKNGKWMWTEYAPGKFDWRTIPSMKQKTGAKPKVETEGKKAEKKQTATKSNKAEKSTAKQTKKGEPKKNSPEAPKMLTIDEFVAMPKNARSNKKPSPAQAEALKLINKGYRITSDKKFFEKDGDHKSCNMDSVTAMFKRYGIYYIPEGLIIK